MKTNFYTRVMDIATPIPPSRFLPIHEASSSVEPKDTGLTLEEIMEFQAIVKNVKGIDLTYEQAQEQGTRMVKLVRLLIQKRPIEYQEIK